MAKAWGQGPAKVRMVYLHLGASGKRMPPNEHVNLAGKTTEGKPKNGLLLIFPSWLEHKTDPNASGKRITVSFNTIRRNLVPHIIAQQEHYGKFPVDNQPRV